MSGNKIILLLFKDFSFKHFHNDTQIQKKNKNFQKILRMKPFVIPVDIFTCPVTRGITGMTLNFYKI